MAYFKRAVLAQDEVADGEVGGYPVSTGIRKNGALVGQKSEKVALFCRGEDQRTNAGSTPHRQLEDWSGITENRFLEIQPFCPKCFDDVKSPDAGEELHYDPVGWFIAGQYFFVRGHLAMKERIPHRIDGFNQPGQ